jgi:hypothetical protein
MKGLEQLADRREADTGLLCDGARGVTITRGPRELGKDDGAVIREFADP